MPLAALVKYINWLLVKMLSPYILAAARCLDNDDTATYSKGSLQSPIGLEAALKFAQKTPVCALLNHRKVRMSKKIHVH